MFRMTRKVLNNKRVGALARQTFFSWGRNDVGAFPSDTIHEPHTNGYLQDQKKICDKYKLSSKFVKIPAGTKLNSFIISGDLLLGSLAVYPKESLTKLSEKEFSKIISWPGNHLSEIEIKEPVDCIALEEDNGKVVYYISPEKFNVVTVTPIEECVLKNDIAVDSIFRTDPSL